MELGVCFLDSSIHFPSLGPKDCRLSFDHLREMEMCLRCKHPSLGKIGALAIQLTAAFVLIQPILVSAGDTNDVFSPCSDAKVQKSDGFTFGVVLSSKDSFFHEQVQLSPCDSRLALMGSNAQLAVFRPKVDEISLLTINSSAFSPVNT